MEEETGKKQDAIIQMLGSMAALDFSGQIETDDSSDPLNVIAQGMNWLNEELEANTVERSRLETINEILERFAYTAAHDMKSPLNSAIGLIRLIEKVCGGCKRPEIDKYLNLLKETNQQMKKLIDGILDYSSANFSSLEMEEIDLGTLIQNVAKEYDANTQVVIGIGSKMPVIRHHETALIQVLSNLVNNAVKYNDKETCKIQIECIDKKDHYEFSVSDNGPGIAKEDEERVFDLFENLKTKKEDSTGIGLATVKKIITETGGRIWIESEEGGGARFVFTIVKNR